VDQILIQLARKGARKCRRTSADYTLFATTEGEKAKFVSELTWRVVKGGPTHTAAMEPKDGKPVLIYHGIVLNRLIDTHK